MKTESVASKRRRLPELVMLVAVLLLTSGLGYAVTAMGAAPQAGHRTLASTAQPKAVTVQLSTPRPKLIPRPYPKPARHRPHPGRALTPGHRVLGSGDQGARVRDLQARLQQIGWFAGPVSGTYGDLTSAAVSGFQAKRRLPVTGYVDQRTLDRLTVMTRQPTIAELSNQVSTAARLDRRCLVGHVICIDKTSQTLRWVVGGRVLKTLDVRFGAAYTPTHEGLFHVDSKDATHVSTLYGSAMPYSMFFSGGQAVHYSSDFAARGYSGASHGCVNVRDYAGVRWLFSQVQVGNPVVVYWS
ncbi:MAG: L,D-transpeptidase family protein [Actinomycetota bacterium]|nr:L,D-transpeptidase family protein [Actinomycetota bacterium]